MVENFKNKFECGVLMQRMLVYFNAIFMYNESYQYNPRGFYWWWLLLLAGGGALLEEIRYSKIFERKILGNILLQKTFEELL